MKKALTIFLTTALLASNGAVWASNFEAHCPNQQNKLKDCKINITGDRLSVEYDSASDQALNVDLDKKQITSLSYGAYAKRRLTETGVATVLLGPVGLFGLLSKKKREEIAVEYINARGQKKIVLFDVKKKFGFTLRKELEAMSGQKFLREQP